MYIAIFHFVQNKKTVFLFLGLGVLLRLMLVFSLPNFSDDIYRFIWDGRLILNGINPFDHLPSYYIENNLAIDGLTLDLYNQLNSPNYFTVYPPVNQFIFATAVWLFPNSILGTSIIMKSFLFLFELGSLFLIVDLLRYFKLPLKNSLLYALNPLIILEISGNLHFEGAMIFFLLLAIWLLSKHHKTFFSALAFSLSIASKLLPLMFLPLLIRRMGKQKSSLNKKHPIFNNRLLQADWLSINFQKVSFYFIIVGLSLLLLFIPLINGAFVSNFGSSLNLYFQRFEFNASLYYLFRWLGFQIRGYNIIATLGPYLALLAFVSIILLTLLEKHTNWKNLFERLLFAICCYLFCTTTIHPWYLALPIVFCLFTSFRFPILWSGLIFMTYINYSYTPYFENLWVVAIEYLLVFAFLIFEIWKYVSLKQKTLEIQSTNN
jgi:hypothetical protein